MLEIWKDIPGYESYYQVSDQGRVRSKDRVTNGPRATRVLKGKVLKPTPLTSGYLYVTLCIKARKYKRLIHRLVLTAFVGQCPTGMECRHFPDPNPSNNTLTNLQWGLPTENGRDRVTHGTSGRGEASGRHKMTENEVKALRTLREYGWSWHDLACKFNISRSQTRRIALRLDWAWLQ